ncbi:MAG: c-type cytochrome [Anaerolineae bacterium]|nr:c-type cytochrome [Anaerolineae bacterium]
MMQRSHRLFALLLLTLAALASAACGSVATPEWAAEAQATQVALAATDEHLTAIAPTNTPTNTPLPTSTPVPPTETSAPTSTPLPPTETPAPTNTPEPPTATSEPTQAAGGPGSGGGNPQPSGDPVAGQVVFTTTYTTASGQWACSLCHTATQDEMRLIGPGLWNVSVRAETRVDGQNAYQYVRHSILAPNDFIVPADAGGPYPPSLMPQNYQEVLTPEELENVIAYLFTLK